MAKLVNANDEYTQYHKLNDTWNLWIHLPHDSDWSIKSYKKLMTCNYVEEIISLMEFLPDDMITFSCLFLMRDGINPMWEDPQNRDGGCFSYKVSNKNVVNTWRNISYALACCAIVNDKKYYDVITGITISPKKNFCIIKIWLSTTKYQNPSIINEICSIVPNGCLFKKHTPEY